MVRRQDHGGAYAECLAISLEAAHEGVELRILVVGICVGSSGSGVTLTPTAEEKLFWDSAEDHVDEVPLWACADEDASLAEEVDPELDRWMASRGRRRFLAATGVAAVMLLTVAFAALGVAVMAQPALIGGSQAAQEMPLERPPPPRPVTPGR